MKVIAIIGVIFILNKFISAEDIDSQPYCFRFTWSNQKCNKQTSNTKKNGTMSAPCVLPIIETDDSMSPNVTHMWNIQYVNRRQNISCPLRSGFACIKYSYSYNNAVLNTTYFCGKMIEDKSLAIDSGCYTQKVGGHIIEACACQSNGGQMPCNNTFSIHQSYIKIIVVAVIILFFQNK